MRVDGTRLDLRTMAEHGPFRRSLIGGRRHIGVGPHQVVVSRLGSREEAGIGIGVPAVEYTIHLDDPPHPGIPRRPVDRDGWLDVQMLEPGYQYWLEFSWLGGVYLDREDQTEENIHETRWYWPLPLDLWEKIRCE